jgi:hypothetical protein
MVLVRRLVLPQSWHALLRSRAASFSELERQQPLLPNKQSEGPVTMKNLNDLRRKIEMTPDRALPRAIREASESYDDFILECEKIPAEGIEFLLWLLSDRRVLAVKGIEHFLLEVNVDFCKYTEHQRDQLLGVLSGNAQHVSDELGRHSVGDLIARAFPADVAFSALKRLSLGTPAERHVAFVGFDVLRLRTSSESSQYPAIQREWKNLMKVAGE